MLDEVLLPEVRMTASLSIFPSSLPVFILVLLSCAPAPLNAQERYEPQRRFQIQFYTGYEAFSNDAAHYTVTTGGNLDYSMNGTRIVVDQASSENVPTIGLRLGMQEIRDRSNFIHNLYLDLLTDAFIGPVYMVKAGINYEPEFRRSTSPLGAFICIGAGISHIWATLGEVGNRSGDIYFETEPGDIYPEGSTISMRSDALPYVVVSFGMRYYISQNLNIFAGAGYQFSHAADIWHYRITNPAEEDMSFDFPDSPFPRSPSAIDQDGTFLRIGISAVPPQE